MKLLLLLTLIFNLTNSLRQYKKEDVLRLRESAKKMFYHGYDSYIRYASQYDELKPLSCSGINTWSSSSLTLIDSLDTLIVLGNYSEFKRVAAIVENIDFDKDINVSVFETNIRIVGGLLSAHLLSHKAGMNYVGFPCNGPLLRLAEKVARKLLPAFDTKTGMPYGTVNLKYSVPENETPITCVAGVGTFVVEWGALSRLTGDPVFEEVAVNALYSLFNHRSQIGLLGNHIDVQTGVWTAQDSGIGAGVDSYYEYLVKGAILLNRPEFMEMFNEGRKALDKYLNKDDWQIWVSMGKGQMTLPVFQSLQAFWPGLLSLVGDVNAAMKILYNMHSVWKQYGFLPEMYNIPNGEPSANRESYPLRPELIESVFYLYRATGDPYLLEVGEDILTSIEHSAKTSCGYATIKNVKDHRRQDTMESFFLAETVKYLYLLFDPDNFLNNDGGYGTIIDTKNGECIIESGYIFNTEAHPIDLGALKCCYDMQRESLVKGFDRKKFMGELAIDKETMDEGENIARTTDNDDDDIGSRSDSKSDEEFKKELMEEIMSALSNANKKLKENTEIQKRFAEMTSRERHNLIENTRVTAAEQQGRVKTTTEGDDGKEEEEEEDRAEKLETIRLSSNALDDYEDAKSEENTTDEGSQAAAAATTTTTATIVDDARKEANIIKKTAEANNNNSIITDFVKNILKTATTKQKKKKFDPSSLFEKIKNDQYGFTRNETWSTKYELLSCKAQAYGNRISVLGEFY